MWASFRPHLTWAAIPPFRPTVASQRDEPGITRAAIPLLNQQGVTGLSVGVDWASPVPKVPRAFVWRDEATNTEVLTSIHGGGYGGHGGQNIYALTEAGNCIVVPVR